MNRKAPDPRIQIQAELEADLFKARRQADHWQKAAIELLDQLHAHAMHAYTAEHAPLLIRGHKRKAASRALASRCSLIAHIKHKTKYDLKNQPNPDPTP
jgi:hypothetical protein